MRYRDLFEKWGLKSLKLKLSFVEMEFVAKPEDQEAAWEMYVELITRVLTQRLKYEDGDEQTALRSCYSLFEITRLILKERGRKAQTFSKIAVIVLNQIVRPFTAKWHKLSLNGAFKDPNKCLEFRIEMEMLQNELRKYAGLLAELACVEDITDINDLCYE